MKLLVLDFESHSNILLHSFKGTIAIDLSPNFPPGWSENRDFKRQFDEGYMIYGLPPEDTTKY